MCALCVCALKFNPTQSKTGQNIRKRHYPQAVDTIQNIVILTITPKRVG